MKKLLALLSLLVVAVSSFAQTFTIGDIEYKVLSPTDRTAQVSNGKNATGDVVIPATVTYDDVVYSVTTISSQAFYQNTNLTSIEMSATSIGEQAFYGCTSLSSVELPAVTSIDSWAFYGCTSLSSVSLPSATSIDNWAFYSSPKISSLRIGSVEQWCNVNFEVGTGSNPLESTSQSVNLYIGDSETPATEIVVPSTVTKIPNCAFAHTTITSFSAPCAETIGSSAFYNCTSLSSVEIPTATSIGSSAFHSCTSLSSVSLPVVTSIGNYAFAFSTSLSSVSFPAATSIGSEAFNECTSLSSLSLPATTSIGGSAFGGCESLSSLSLPAATSIGSSAFNGCTSLSSVSLPVAETIGGGAFYSCSKINSLRIGSAEQWCNVNFGGSFANPLQSTSQSVDLFIGDSETPATDIVIPGTVKNIPDFAFRFTTITSFSAQGAETIGNFALDNCTSLSSADLSAATSIGDYAFSSCYSLSLVSLAAATSIGDYAFSYCTSLSSISLQTSLSSENLPSGTSVGCSAFYYCTSLSSVSLPAATSIGSSAFYGCTSLSSVSFPSATSIGNSAFSGCESLVEAIMPKVETIESGAFSGSTDYDGNEWHNHYCTSLKYLDLSSVKSIGSSTFINCISISSLRIGSVEQWCNVNFGGPYSSPLNTSQSIDLFIGGSETPATEIVIPSTVTNIPAYAFRGCTTITTLSAPSAETIGSYAFYNCTSLSSVSLSATTSIGSYAFEDCTSLSSVSLPVATSIGSNAFRRCTSLSAISLPAATSIGSWAFGGCTSLSSVSLPVVTSIDYNAFDNCTSLSSVSLPAAETIAAHAFYTCSKISSLRIGSIEQWCNVNFGGSYSSPLYSASQPVNLYIGGSETPTTDIVVPGTVKSIPDYAFYNTTITSISALGAETIGDNTFRNCASLSSVSLPTAISIGNYAFQNCVALEEALMPKVEIIGDYAFGPRYGADGTCTSLKRVDISSITSIGANAFYDCRSLDIVHLNDIPPILAGTNSFSTWTMIAVPDKAYQTYLATDVYKEIPLQITKEGSILKEVELEADNATSKLLQTIGEEEVRYVVNLKISGTINSYDMLIIRNQMPSLRNLDLTDASIVDCDYVYSNAESVYYHSQKDVVTADWLSGVMNVKLPKTTKSIGYKAFYTDYDKTSKLVSVTIPDGVTSIGDYAFSGCSNIKELILPQSVTSYGAYAFDGCAGLRKVVIPDGVTTIGYAAFRGYRDLEEVTIPASVTNIGWGAFEGERHYVNIDGIERWEGYPITLRINNLNSWLNIDFDGPAFSGVGKLYVGYSDEPVEEIAIPAGTTEIKSSTFANFKCIKSLALPNELTSIGSYAFSGCYGLTGITLPEKLSSIGSYAFNDCFNIEKIELPPYLETIDSYAFQNCLKLKEVLIPASIQEIGDYAFYECPKLNRVIATTVEPVRINQNTFSTYQTATLYSPKTSYYKYYWNTQYNQFLAKKEYDKEFAKTFGYKYFYLNGMNGDTPQDFTVDNTTDVVHGTTDESTGKEEAPDADFNEGAGMIVDGKLVQELGDIHIHHNGNNGASVIAKNSGKVHIDNLYVDIKVQKNRWYFFCFPFDINPGDATFDGSYVWYLYDGEARAKNGNGGWKKIAADGVMKSGNGYIFQGAVNGTLTVHVQDITIDTADNSTNMITYQSDNKNDASWNLIGNSNFAYYDMANLSYDAPITVYNNSTSNYDAVRPVDDDYEFYPFQAFFVQKPESAETMNFSNAHKETKNKSDENKAKKAAARAKAPKKVNPMRKVINLELATVDADAEATATAADRTRIVVNPTKSTSYETDCDAAKFIADNMPQIYSLDNEGAMYSINERPVGNGIINIAVKAPKDGVFTISAARLDCAAKLRDLETGTEVDLAEGGYTFAAEAGTFANRFQLILADGATAITTPEEAKAAISVESGAISVNDANADVKVYSVGGALVGSQKGAGSINVPTGAYVVKVNGQSVKVTVNE